MSIGVIIPNSGILPTRLGIAAMAVEAEAAGAAGLWVSDHLLMVDEEITNYPYSADGRLTWDVKDDYFEALTTCSVIGAVTETAAVGTAVLVLPQRNPLQLAKEAATIDRLIGGRFILGVGAGWNGPEMKALGYSFADRGRRMDEDIRILQSSWSGEPPAFQGSFESVTPGVMLFPRPAQEYGVPVLSGGMAPAALRRAARSTGWLAIAFVQRWDPESLHVAMDLFKAETAHAHGSAFAVLKLHCSVEKMHDLAACAGEALAMGFAHVIVEVPWSEGIKPACDVLKSVISVTTQPVPEARWWTDRHQEG